MSSLLLFVVSCGAVSIYSTAFCFIYYKYTVVCIWRPVSAHKTLPDEDGRVSAAYRPPQNTPRNMLLFIPVALFCLRRRLVRA